jgi:hypothetical protein
LLFMPPPGGLRGGTVGVLVVSTGGALRLNTGEFQAEAARKCALKRIDSWLRSKE